MRTRARLLIVTDDPGAGHAALLRGVEDLEATERALSRFWKHSDLSRLNRSGTLVAGERLLAAIETAIEAYEWSDGLLDPRVVGSLERFGYRECRAEPSGRVSLLSGVQLDLAGVGKAMGASWAAMCLAGHAGLLVDVGDDIVALGTDEGDEPWTIAVFHREVVGQFSGNSLAIATSATKKRAWIAGDEVGAPPHRPTHRRALAPPRPFSRPIWRRSS